MKKVLFLMFLLLLIVLGTANIKAQVRIGGDGAPNAAAVLDLNATDGTTGTKGLALPRVSLTNVNTPLAGTPVVNGMLIYNTNATVTGGSGVGLYYWNGIQWLSLITYDTQSTLKSLELFLDTTMSVTAIGSGWGWNLQPAVPAAKSSDLCVCGYAGPMPAEAGNGVVYFLASTTQGYAYNVPFRCYHIK